MNKTSRASAACKIARMMIICALLLSGLAGGATAHPLGNFTINHFARIEVRAERITIRYVVDMAEIPAFQELQAIDSDGDGSTSSEELSVYGEREAARYAEGILLSIDGRQVQIDKISSSISVPAGAGNLSTLRVECNFVSEVEASLAGVSRELIFEDTNHGDRIGWHEIVVNPTDGLSVFNSSAYGSGLTDEIKAYPEDSLSAPLNERAAGFSFTHGAIPPGARALLMRNGQAASQSRDRLAELIAAPELTPLVALFGLFIAAMLGALHALSPGHGKTVVGAYLVGSRGTARHAAFLGLTVTITHTLGVFALGLVTLFASRYVVPEKLFPILSLVSGGIVLAIGLSLFIRRLRSALGHSLPAHSLAPNDGSHDHSHGHFDHDHVHDHVHSHEGHSHAMHSHGGRPHSHLPPGADGNRVTWRSLLALGISGGLLPCPSALVVLLSAISLHRVGYGIVLVVAFSTGLAATLTSVGLLFVYAGRLMKRPLGSGRLVRVLPVVSAFIIACAGAVICYEAASNAGLNLLAPVIGFLSLFNTSMLEGNSISTASVLTIGLVFGLKHAVEADHLAAVSTIVSERKSLISSSIVGGLWGVGHTISLLIAGVAVLLLHIEIGEKTALALEFCVALMLIALGSNALRKLSRGKLHFHSHQHGGLAHLHPHVHAGPTEAAARTHHGLSFNTRPLLIGMVHGLAGSAALMLLVLSTVKSSFIGLIFITVFGIGSIGGMLIMSALVSLPLQLTATRFKRANRAVQMLAAMFSLGLGLLMVYEIGFLDGLFG
jgi:ABC-type nickel/cobalt efflux system permease component RcnA